MCLERVAERVSSLSKLKSVLVTDSHAQLLQRPCSATYGHEQRRRRLPSSSGDALPEGLTVCSVRIVPSAPGRSCPPTYCQELGGLFTFWRRAGAHLRFSRKFWFGWQAAGRQAGFRLAWGPTHTSCQLESASRRAQTCRRLGWRLWVPKRKHSMSTRRRRLDPSDVHSHWVVTGW